MRLRAEEPGKFIKFVASGFKFIKLFPDPAAKLSGLACSIFDLSSGFKSEEFFPEDPDFLCRFELELELELFDEDADRFLSRSFDVPELCLFLELEFEVVEEAADNFRSRFFDPRIPVGGVLPLLMALRGIRHIKIGRPSNLLRMVGSVFTSTLTGTGTKDSRTGTAFPPPLVGAGLCPFRLLGVDFLTAKMLLMAAFFLSDSPAAGVTSEVTGCEADWLLRR